MISHLVHRQSLGHAFFHHWIGGLGAHWSVTVIKIIGLEEENNTNSMPYKCIALHSDDILLVYLLSVFSFFFFLRVCVACRMCRPCDSLNDSKWDHLRFHLLLNGTTLLHWTMHFSPIFQFILTWFRIRIVRLFWYLCVDVILRVVCVSHSTVT